jgi:hypothetical protein
MAGDAVGEIGSVCANIALAVVVPSVPQTGQFTANGIFPLTGSTSNLNF